MITPMTDNDSSGELVPAGTGPNIDDLAAQLVASANDQGIQLTGEGGLLTALTRRVFQTALEAEMGLKAARLRLRTVTASFRSVFCTTTT
jgi:hypothetical protein